MRQAGSYLVVLQAEIKRYLDRHKPRVLLHSGTARWLVGKSHPHCIGSGLDAIIDM